LANAQMDAPPAAAPAAVTGPDGVTRTPTEPDANLRCPGPRGVGSWPAEQPAAADLRAGPIGSAALQPRPADIPQGHNYCRQ
ncbi:MAG: hypothetical protein QOD96_5071, partial [Pseudonocardiales bacterium]|nr:hypothetical protein [Pseudonocardiales bacterium]